MKEASEQADAHTAPRLIRVKIKYKLGANADVCDGDQRELRWFFFQRVLHGWSLRRESPPPASIGDGGTGGGSAAGFPPPPSGRTIRITRGRVKSRP